MARPKLNEEEKKVKLGITISKDLLESIEKITNNKSKFIDSLIREYMTQYNLMDND